MGLSLKRFPIHIKSISSLLFIFFKFRGQTNPEVFLFSSMLYFQIYISWNLSRERSEYHYFKCVMRHFLNDVSVFRQLFLKMFGTLEGIWDEGKLRIKITHEKSLGLKTKDIVCCHPVLINFNFLPQLDRGISANQFIINSFLNMNGIKVTF